jgi:hypothetical protein
MLLGPAAAGATKPADVRVLTTQGRALAEFTQYTGTTSVKASRAANCFGPGTGGSGDRHALAGATALGLVVDAAEHQRPLRPILVTDSFGFGLGVCGFGRAVAESGETFWNLRVNHVESTLGGDQVKLDRRDNVLWYLAPDRFPQPNAAELELRAPARSRPGEVRVRVLRHACEFDSDSGEYICTREPAAGVTVLGGEAPAATGADGTALVPVEEGKPELRARRADLIPSNVVEVCVRPRLRRCPAAHGKDIYGSDRADRIRGTRGWDTIRARGDDDEIDVSNGGRDRINCGPGDDRVLVSAGVGDDRMADNCERVVRG